MRSGGRDGSAGPMWRLRASVREDAAQASLEYALTVAALAALWRAGEDGTLARLVEQAASHALAGTGPLDIALY